MKVKDVMQTSVISVSEDALIKEVAQMIFSIGISGAPVVKGNNLVGIVTEEDILAHMYTNDKKNTQDYMGVQDFNLVEHNIVSLLDKPVSTIMNRNVLSITGDEPVMKAQGLMLNKKFSRVPVVNKKKELIGIISQGDIFREVLKEEMPVLEKDRFASFMSTNYDMMIDWEQRFEEEFPSLFRIFKKESVQKVLDLGVWSGIFSIGLAQEGLSVTALEQNKLMLEIANKKREALPPVIKDNIQFFNTDYSDIKSVTNGEYDAALCLGNALLYMPGDLSHIFTQVHSVLKQNGICIIQIINVNRVLEKKKRLLNFQIQKPSELSGHERLFLEFLDKKDKDIVRHNLAVFDSSGGSWVYQGGTAIDMKFVQEKEISKTLKEVGFSDISVGGYQGEYQGEYSPISFIKPFDASTSDWMTIVARK